MVKESFPNCLGKALCHARKDRQLTQTETASLAGVSRPTITLLERGRGRIASWCAVLSAFELELVGRNLPAGNTIGLRLAALRRRRELSQRALAKLVCCSHPTLVALEKGRGGRLLVLDRSLAALGAGAYLAPNNQVRPFYSHAGTSSVCQTWRTPSWVLEKLYTVFGSFDLDPCSPCRDARSAPVRASVRFTAKDDGLSVPWFGTVFIAESVFCPFSKVPKGKDHGLGLKQLYVGLGWWKDFTIFRCWAITRFASGN
jgi:transcriptional regulator with XRE-family HTH domain